MLVCSTRLPGRLVCFHIDQSRSFFIEFPPIRRGVDVSTNQDTIRVSSVQQEKPIIISPCYSDYIREGDDMNQKFFCFFSQVSLFKSFMKSVFIFAHLFKITLFMVCRLLASPEIQNEYKYFP